MNYRGENMYSEKKKILTHNISLIKSEIYDLEIKLQEKKDLLNQSMGALDTIILLETESKETELNDKEGE